MNKVFILFCVSTANFIGYSNLFVVSSISGNLTRVLNLDQVFYVCTIGREEQGKATTPSENDETEALVTCLTCTDFTALLPKSLYFWNNLISIPVSSSSIPLPLDQNIG